MIIHDIGSMYLLSHYNKAVDMFKHLVVEVKTQLECRVRTLQIDRVYECLLDKFKEYCEGKVYEDNL